MLQFWAITQSKAKKIIKLWHEIKIQKLNKKAILSTFIRLNGHHQNLRIG